jgi:hypothetical protein
MEVFSESLFQEGSEEINSRPVEEQVIEKTVN